ncbi:MAG: lipopolysaccharide biosynthesis protein [Xanthomonadaceae bacterium]|jgi:UDP-N-acetylmuramyl pentapeptide phosphotransferase/UDP-N-acetylglucosamine-1-phosphate transferase|nr:lipopolysaccharide biosynthesis protein [Xanthomonadaceae bacterium]
MRWLPWALLHLFVAVLGTWAARRYALRRNLFDQPGERRSHTVATPRGGGIGIVVALLAGSVYWVSHAPDSTGAVAGFAVGLLMVAMIGWVDDHRPLSPWLRLMVHIVASAILGWTVYRATDQWLCGAIAFFASVALINIWNFMDGINGLAASQAALAALGVLLLSAHVDWLALGLLAACLGFLPFNFPKARIFMGDVGSGALGYCIAAMLAHAGGHERGIEWALLALPISAFMVDACMTLGLRMLKRERWWAPHTQHVYQHWVKHGRGHTFVTFAYAVFSLCAAVSAIILRIDGVTGGEAILAVAGWYLSALILWLILRNKFKELN